MGGVTLGEPPFYRFRKKYMDVPANQRHRAGSTDSCTGRLPYRVRASGRRHSGPPGCAGAVSGPGPREQLYLAPSPLQVLLAESEEECTAAAALDDAVSSEGAVWVATGRRCVAVRRTARLRAAWFRLCS